MCTRACVFTCVFKCVCVCVCVCARAPVGACVFARCESKPPCPRPHLYSSFSSLASGRLTSVLLRASTLPRTLKGKSGCDIASIDSRKLSATGYMRGASLGGASKPTRRRKDAYLGALNGTGRAVLSCGHGRVCMCVRVCVCACVRVPARVR